jgi:hypothetical protein
MLIGARDVQSNNQFNRPWMKQHIWSFSLDKSPERKEAEKDSVVLQKEKLY